jgi:hypothetical protein
VPNAWKTERAGWPGAETPALFLNRRGGRLTARAVDQLLDEFSSDADLIDETGKPFASTHTLRHTFGTNLLRAGVDIVVAQLMGHRRANFVGTRFIGGANFAHANFEEYANFHRARFEGGAGHFFGAGFGWRAVFVGADFGEKEANFEGATFAGMVLMDDTTFGDGVTLDQARGLAGFNMNWGSERRWPAGWTERPLTNDEQMLRPYGRWANAPGGFTARGPEVAPGHSRRPEVRHQ